MNIKRNKLLESLRFSRGIARQHNMRVAFIKGYALGDVVRCTAITRAIKRQASGARITWFCSQQAFPLLLNNPDICETVSLTDRSNGSRQGHFDWVISLDEDRVSSDLAASIRTQRLSGVFSDATGSMRFTDDLAEWYGMGLLGITPSTPLELVNQKKRANQRSYLSMLYDGLGIDFPLCRPIVHLSTPERQIAREMLRHAAGDGSRPIIGVFLGGGRRWERKQWTPDQAGRILRHLSTRLDAEVVVLGGIEEADQLSKLSDAGYIAAQTALTFTSVRTLTAVVECLSLLITTDSLPLHLAVAVNTPLLALFGPTSATEIDIFDNGTKLITPLPCRCCYLNTCTRAEDCRDSFEMEMIVDNVRSMLRFPKERPRHAAE